RGIVVTVKQLASNLNWHVESRQVLDAGGDRYQGAQQLPLVFDGQSLVFKILVVSQPRFPDSAPKGDLTFRVHVPHEADLELLQRHAEVQSDHVVNSLDLSEQIRRQRSVTNRPWSELAASDVFVFAQRMLTSCTGCR